MDQFYKTREALLKLNEEIASLIRQAEIGLGNSTTVFDQWKSSNANIAKNLTDHVMRIAVVGAIKSGKSTLVNALLQGDYLKRGAGVVTSIVTRIRRGNKLKASLYFKSWDDINTEIERALVLFPSEQWQPESQRFDIRRSKDRNDLAIALEALDADLHLASDGLNANSVLLTSYLKGYDQVQAMVAAESTIAEFDAERFAEHRAFVGDDRLAVYLKDIQLDITGKALDTNIEMADCQGSDSPNPLHMAMIQDYLLKAHLVVYVVSSRTGLRQADIRFLSIIKQMGIAHNMLFVINCDIDEHESLADLNSLVQKISEELALVLPDAHLFIFSALYHLFDMCRASLSVRNTSRLKQWDKSEELANYSNAEVLRLKNALGRKLTQERSALMLQNQIERIDIIQAGLLNWTRLTRRFLERDVGEAQAMVDRFQSHQGYMVQVQSMIRGTLDGGIQRINKELKKEIDRFFDRFNGPVLGQILGFVRNYTVDLNRYRDQVLNSGFTQALYVVFQEFKQAVDVHMAEKINPEIIGFIGQLESRLASYLQSVVEPYEAMVRDAVGQYEAALAQFELDRIPGKWAMDTVPDLESVKQGIGLSLPPAAATMRYSANIKTDAVIRWGFYALTRVVRKILRKPMGIRGDEELKALKDGIRRMKRETERSIMEHFKDYQENIKFQYMQRLVDAAGVHLYEELTKCFRMYVSDLKELIDSMGNERSGREHLGGTLGAVEAALEAMQPRIETLRLDVSRMRGEVPPGSNAKDGKRLEAF
jgi:GTPase SAR1 family protein